MGMCQGYGKFFQIEIPLRKWNQPFERTPLASPFHFVGVLKNALCPIPGFASRAAASFSR